MLRALACVALQQQFDDTVPPTMAEDRVFDSRLDPLVFKQFEKPMPGIIVYTDDDNGELLNRGSGDGPFRRWIDLRIEIVIGSFDTEIIDSTQNVVFDLPMTDAQLEAQLDLFEAQTKWALFQLPNRVYTNAFRAFVMRIESINSHASRDETGNNRFASRRIHFRCEVNDDCPPGWYGLDNGQPRPATIPFCDKLENFPAPWITPMLQAMCSQPAMQGVLNMLAGTGNPYTYVPLLKRIGINVDAIAPEADPNLLAAQGKTQGPDGRIEVQKLLEL
jgi:hypothetical protein